jgi:hypothetical protein
VGYSPPIFSFWGHIPQTPWEGAPPPPPPFVHPRWLRVCQRFGSHSWRGCRGAARPLLRFCGGAPTTTPRQGGSAPWTPCFPTLVGLGFASVLGPTRGGVARVGYSPPIFSFWGHIPQTPWEGAAPPPPPFVHPRGLRVCQRFGSHSWRGCRGAARPLLRFCGGGTHHDPPPGGFAPWTPVFPPSWALGPPAFWAPLVAGLQELATRLLLGFVGDTPHNPPPWGLCPPGPPFSHPCGLR